MWETQFSHWVQKIPCRMEWQPTPVFLPGEFHEPRSLAGYSLWGHKESDMTEWTSVFLSAFFMVQLTSVHDCWKNHSFDYLHLFFCFCSEFCHTLEWNSHGFTCAPHPDSPLPPPSPPAPPRFSQCTRSERLSHASNLGWWSVSP